MEGKTHVVIRSMTGYGRAEGRYKTVPIVVEVRSVNHRHCEVVTRLPKIMQRHEERFRKQVQDRLSRGRIDVSVSFNGDGEPAGLELRLDHALARQYLAALKELQRDLRFGNRAAVARDLADIRRDRMEIRNDLRDLQRDRRGY